jgi:transcriptional regulator with XRE-family HTH domain
LNQSTSGRKGFVDPFDAYLCGSAEIGAMRNLMGKKKLTGLAMRLRPLRAKMGVTQSEVAAAVGIERSTLAGIESGNAMASRATLAALADFYQVTIDYLENGTAAASQQLALDTAQTEEEATLLRIVRLLDENQRGGLITGLKALIGDNQIPHPSRHRRHS